MKQIFFLVNRLEEFDIGCYIKQNLDGFLVSVGESLPPAYENYDLVVLWNYRKILNDLDDAKNVVVFHSSDLPKGKGWAPIYHALADGNEEYVISGILASKDVDSGDMIIQARYKMQSNYTALKIREWDNEICIMMVREIFLHFTNRNFQGVKQMGDESYYPRRKLEDNEIALDSRLADIVNHLRGCEKEHPAYFLYKGYKYHIHVEPEIVPDFPNDLEFVFFD
ncbi:MAG: hypothetical protein P4N59_01610 [Negativicutes bacterium]|nr:hypothetical protein [Negativicutes bacterium]